MNVGPSKYATEVVPKRARIPKLRSNTTVHDPLTSDSLLSLYGTNLLVQRLTDQ
jgi:hypothetical protein